MALPLLITLGSLGLGVVARPVDSPLNNIKNVVVLVQENRSFDTLAGGFTYNHNIDGLVNHRYCNPRNVSMPNSGSVCAANTAKNVASDDPMHFVTGVNMQVFGNYHPTAHSKESMQGFITEQAWAYGLENNMSRAAEVMNYYTPDLVPVTNAMAENFVLFDRWFAAIPGPTDCNRAYLTSGTSAGNGDNGEVYYTAGMKQNSIFQQLSEKGISWINYENTTNIGPGSFPPDAMFYDWVAKNAPQNIKPIDRFYSDAKAGTLPQFSWINPECCDYMSMHPASPVNMGENFMRGIYQSLRQSPQWNETLFIITFDEHGGFADHVPPPTGVPAGDNLTWTETAPDGKNYTFNFERLGVRVPTMLISPWVGKGVVQNRPASGNSEFTHTSILKFLSELWNLETLTPRVAWSPSFGNLITNNFRADAPAHLPQAAGYPI